jgi:hypothetical protein
MKILTAYGIKYKEINMNIGAGGGRVGSCGNSKLAAM